MVPAPDPRPSRLARLAKRLAALLAGLALGVAALEAALRLTDWQPYLDPIGPRGLFVADPELGLRLRPGFEGRHRHPEYDVAVAVNAAGLREDRALAPKPPGTFRILSLGDSFAYGHGVEIEQTYGRLLEGRLGCEVWNAGAPTYGQRHMRLALAKYKDAVEPDLVLATFLFANDLLDNAGPGPTERGGLVISPEVAAFVDRSGPLSFAFDHSDVLLYLTLGWYKWRHDYDPAPALAPDVGPHEAWPDLIEFRAVERPPELELGWRNAEEHLAGLAREARAAGCALVLIDLPLWYQVDPAAWESIRARHGLAEEDYALTYAADRLAAFCAREGIHFFDTLRALRSEPGASELYHGRDRHFNAAGHARVAEGLEAFLRERGLVPD